MGERGGLVGMTSDEARELFLRELPMIEKIIGTACRRSGLSSEAEDVAGAIRLKLIENDYRVIREFSGRSSFSTYVTVVVQRFVSDHRNHVWGRWRPSAEAIRMGDHAVQLETLLVRDGRTLDEACQILMSSESSVTREELEQFAERFPSRVPRPTTHSLEDAEVLTWYASHETPHERLVEKERGLIGLRAAEAMDAAIKRLPAEERLILRMRFTDAMTVAQVARATGLPQRQLYTRLERIVAELRKALQVEGIDREQIHDLLRHGAVTVNLPGLGNCPPTPSTEGGGLDAAKVRAE